MSNKTFKCLTAGALLTVSMPLFAFGLSSLPVPGAGGGSQQATSNKVDAVSAQDGIVRDYRVAALKIATAQHDLILAFGFKDQAAALDAYVTWLKSGPVIDKDAIDKITQQSNANSQLITADMDKEAALNEDGKQKYVNSLLPFANGVAMTAKMPADLKNFGDAAKAEIQSASLLDKAKVVSKLSTGTHLAEVMPGYLATLMDTMKKLVTYGQKNNVPIPSDATALL